MKRHPIEERAARVVAEIADLPVREALAVFLEAQRLVLTQAKAEPELEAQAVSVPPQFLRSRRGRPSKIRDNPVVRDFIYSLPGDLSTTAIAARCLDEFGPELAPSKSAVHRHQQELRLQCKRGTS